MSLPLFEPPHDEAVEDDACSHRQQVEQQEVEVENPEHVASDVLLLFEVCERIKFISTNIYITITSLNINKLMYVMML